MSRPFWSRETILMAIIMWSEEHGRPPAGREWRQAGPGHPSADTVQRHFGSFRAAVELTGYEPRRGGYARRWTRERVAVAMLLWLARFGEWPTFRDWLKPDGNPRTGRTDRPHANTVLRVFPTWRAAQRYAGRVAKPTAKERRDAQREVWREQQRRYREAA